MPLATKYLNREYFLGLYRNLPLGGRLANLNHFVIVLYHSEVIRTYSLHYPSPNYGFQTMASKLQSLNNNLQTTGTR